MITLKREIVWTGELPHLSGLPHLPGGPPPLCKQALIRHKGRNTLGDELQQQVAETDHSLCAGRASSCSNKLRRRIAGTSGFVCTGDFLVKNFLSNRILSLQQVAQILSHLIFCDMLQRQRFSQKSSSTHVSPRHVIANCHLVCSDLNWRLR